MRVSDRATARNYLKYLNTAKNNYAKTNEQIASGNRFSRLSDDVSAGTRVMRSRMDMYKSDKQLDNVKSIADELSVAESSMMSMSDIMGRVKTTVLKAMSEEKGEAARKAVADEIKAMRSEFLQLANTKFGKNYTFGGTNASFSAPFSVDKEGYLEYNGIPVDSILKDADGYHYFDENGDRQSIPMDEDVFMDVGLGIPMNAAQLDGKSGFKISFSGLDIVGFGKNEEGLPNNIYNILTDIEGVLRDFDADKLGKLSDHMEKQRDVFGGNLTDIGAKTGLLETMQTRLENQSSSYKERIKGLMGVNEEEAAVSQAMNDYVLKAVMQMGSKILPLSLMDFLR